MVKFASMETGPILTKICLSFSVNFDWANSTRIKLLFVDESNKTTWYLQWEYKLSNFLQVIEIPFKVTLKRRGRLYP